MNMNGDINVNIAFRYLFFLLRQHTIPTNGNAITITSNVKTINCIIMPSSIIFCDLIVLFLLFRNQFLFLAYNLLNSLSIRRQLELLL